MSRAYKRVPPSPRSFVADGLWGRKRGMKARENAIGRGKHEKGAQKRATCFALLQNKLKNDVAVSRPRSVKPVNNLICCKTGLIWVVKRATSLFNSFCRNVARQVFLVTLLAVPQRALAPCCPIWYVSKYACARGEVFHKTSPRQNSFSTYRRTCAVQIQTAGGKRNEPLYIL